MEADVRESSKILIVDDEPTNVRLLDRVLRRHGYTHVTGVTDALSVVDTYDQLRPDIVVLDLHMPGLDGFGVIGKLKANLDPDEYLPILVVTADVNPEVRLRALERGATDFLTKPFDHGETVLRIHNLLEIRHLHTELRRHNDLLEERVRERTRDLEHAIDRIRRAERVRDEFISNVSHELRTPLVPILGWSDMIATREDLPPAEVRDFARTIGRAGRRLVQVIDSLLRIAEIRRDEVKPRPGIIDVDTVLEPIEEASQAFDHALSVDVGAQASTVVADERYLGEILHHLVENAVKFSPAGSPIEIVVTREARAIAFSVIDHGPGIAEADRAAVFDDVEQLDGSSIRARGGLGAGLYIARALIEAHGGMISIQDTDGGGTTVAFTIPQPPDEPRSSDQNRVPQD